jgi:DNA repair protein RadC
MQSAYSVPIVKVQIVREGKLTQETSVTSPGDVARLLHTFLDDLDREAFAVVMLNTKNKVIGVNMVSLGMLDSAIVHPREVFKPAILANAASVIVAHNHPSGDPSPSREDIHMTKRLVQAGDILGIPVLDHLIMGDGCHTSLKERGVM